MLEGLELAETLQLFLKTYHTHQKDATAYIVNMAPTEAAQAPQLGTYFAVTHMKVPEMAQKPQRHKDCKGIARGPYGICYIGFMEEIFISSTSFKT